MFYNRSCHEIELIIYCKEQDVLSHSALCKVNVIQSCLTLCNPMDYTVHGILQARILEWVAIPISRGSSKHRD